MTTLKTIGTLPRNVSKVEGSGACRVSRRRCIISNTCSAVSPQPRSKPNPCNLNKEEQHKVSSWVWQFQRVKKYSLMHERVILCGCCLSIYKLTHIQTQNRVSQLEVWKVYPQP